MGQGEAEMGEGKGEERKRENGIVQKVSATIKLHTPYMRKLLRRTQNLLSKNPLQYKDVYSRTTLHI